MIRTSQWLIIKIQIIERAEKLYHINDQIRVLRRWLPLLVKMLNKSGDMSLGRVVHPIGDIGVKIFQIGPPCFVVAGSSWCLEILRELGRHT